MPPDLDTMARRLTEDGWLPIADRLFAAEIMHRRQLRLRVDADAALRLRRLYTQRRTDLARPLALYDDQPSRAA